MSVSFSFIILTYNEEIHFPRLLDSIKGLGTPLYILDSGSTDKTVSIAEKFGATVLYNAFENHPRQWNVALNNFDISTPWVICLDADQVVSSELFMRLKNFDDRAYAGVDGIYFNRKNFFKGRWIKHGGYFPKYLLKMFRFGKGHSDLNENMDHRFVVNGKCMVWPDGYISEENLKENNILFWIEKHNRYSSLVAQEEFERRSKYRLQTIKPDFFGTPDQRTAFYKSLWWRMPLFLRPFLYFTYRYFFQLGFLDGKQGFIFHFLQAFWFRLVVDIKLDELIQESKQGNP